MNEKMREEFEAWATQQAIEHKYEYMPRLLTRHPDSGDYNTTWVDSAWMGWKASRESLVIELPNRMDSKYCLLPGFDDVSYAKDVWKAVEEAGVKVVNQ